MSKVISGIKRMVLMDFQFPHWGKKALSGTVLSLRRFIPNVNRLFSPLSCAQRDYRLLSKHHVCDVRGIKPGVWPGTAMAPGAGRALFPPHPAVTSQTKPRPCEIWWLRDHWAFTSCCWEQRALAVGAAPKLTTFKRVTPRQKIKTIQAQHKCLEQSGALRAISGRFAVSLKSQQNWATGAGFGRRKSRCSK